MQVEKLRIIEVKGSNIFEGCFGLLNLCQITKLAAL